jgi:hypothetical protein
MSWEDASPVPLLPPLRRAETSVAAMMAVLSPPMTPIVVNAAAKRIAQPVAGSGASVRGIEPKEPARILPMPTAIAT